MNMIDIIIKKAKKKELNAKEIDFFVQGYTKNQIPDYQVSSLLMAILLNGMTLKETTALTKSMLDSGKVNDLSTIQGVTVDKHSTGGVGDKTTLVLAPLVASCGLVMAKMSGRGLGHTGGTIDKLESIPGFNTSLSSQQFFDQVNRIHVAVIGQTDELVPADKKLYALRDVTGTVDSMPLIASSIISKKIASGAQIIELDVKYGDGAFMKTKKDAKALAQLMIQVGKRLNKKIRAVISDMNEPLGYAIGNNLEVIESIETLKGRGPQDLKNLCLHICADFLVAAKRFKQYDEALQFATKQLESQAALEKFKEFVIAQGGDVRCVDDYSYFKQAKYTYSILSEQTGKIKKVKALQIGHAAMLLGGGRQSKEDIIDMSAGIVLKVKAKETIKKQEPLAVLYTDKPLTKEIETLVKSAFVFEK
ncbi:MAG TPA: thymidine phosphorylase [Candidatus Caccosoma faecigallinarum]|uniref:Pyrimidine-nucleoside phosphorylase n=1 Tax=Candidatus Caccosoma faecigallinarum TaxID=2840720 RepID=A0A9D1G9B4_9FIRM|nr:thymidine phosphorylase [Candidatus Caccosoma faecigallinarum]